MFSSSSPSVAHIEAIPELIPTTITPKVNSRLLAPYTKEQIKIAVKQMFPTKSPGPDGFPLLFYQKYWNIVGPKTVEACLHILNNNMKLKN